MHGALKNVNFEFMIEQWLLWFIIGISIESCDIWCFNKKYQCVLSLNIYTVLLEIILNKSNDYNLILRLFYFYFLT